MSDIIDDLAREIGEPVEKTLTLGDKSGPVYFKPMTGAQKAQLLRGKKVGVKQGDDSVTMDVDLELNERESHLVIAFCCCNAEGKARYKNSAEVAALPAQLIAALAKLAGEVNKAHSKADEPGES